MTAVIGVQESLARDEAQALVQQIRESQAKIAADVNDVLIKIDRLYSGCGWAALGYGSWEECAREEFSEVRLWKTVEERVERSKALRDAQMSLRGIAAVMGISHVTVQRDLSAVTDVTTNTPVIQIHGVDGATHPAVRADAGAIEERRSLVKGLQEKGKTQKEIAAALHVSQGTVSSDLASLSKVGSPGKMAKILDLVDTDSVDSPLPGDAERYVMAAKSNLAHLHSDVVMADEWTEDERVRERIVRALAPAIVDVLITVSSIVREVALADLPDDEAVRLRWTKGIAQASAYLGQVR